MNTVNMARLSLRVFLDFATRWRSTRGSDGTRTRTTYGKKLGKASVTGCCIRIKALKDINIDTLEAAIRHALAAQNEKGKLMK